MFWLNRRLYEIFPPGVVIAGTGIRITDQRPLYRKVRPKVRGREVEVMYPYGGP